LVLKWLLVFSNISWEAVRIEGLWDESINMYTCDGDSCQSRQDDATHFPEYLFAEIEQSVLKDLTFLLQAPQEAVADKQSPLRS
jgi:hypothetical protein